MRRRNVPTADRRLLRLDGAAPQRGLRHGAGHQCSMVSSRASVPCHSLTSTRKAAVSRAAGVDVPEQHGLEALAAPLERELRVLAADHAGPEHVEGVVERRRRQPLAPDVARAEPRQANVELAAARASRRFRPCGRARPRQQLARDGLEDGAEGGQGALLQRETAAKAWPPNFTIAPGARLVTVSRASRR
jgi:hypothetical protein